MDARRIIGRLQAIPPVLWIILLMMLVFSLISGRYMTMNNMINTVQQGAVLLIVAAAATMIILSEGLDLSLGGVLTIAGVTTVMTLNAKLPVPLAVMVGVATGAACGAATGCLVAVFKMPPFIATLGMQGILFGLALVVTNSIGIFTSNQAFTILGGKAAGFIPMAAVCAGAVFYLVWLILHHTRFGRYVVAIGGNEAGSHLSGVNTVFWKWMVYTFAGLVTGFGGVVLAARLEVADPIVGMGWEFDAIAATILGGTSFQKGRGNVSGTIIGVLLITVLRNGLNVIGTPSILQPALIGTVLILAIVFQVWMSIRSDRVKK